MEPSSVRDSFVVVQEGFRGLHDDKIGCQSIVCFTPNVGRSNNENVRCTDSRIYKSTPSSSCEKQRLSIKGYIGPRTADASFLTGRKREIEGSTPVCFPSTQTRSPCLSMIGQTITSPTPVLSNSSWLRRRWKTPKGHALLQRSNAKNRLRLEHAPRAIPNLSLSPVIRTQITCVRGFAETKNLPRARWTTLARRRRTCIGPRDACGSK